MKKALKWFSIFILIGTAIGLVVAYFCRHKSDDMDDNEMDFMEDEDFDLDADLQPAEREYVSLKKDNIEQPDPDSDTTAKETVSEDKSNTNDSDK